MGAMPDVARRQDGSVARRRNLRPVETVKETEHEETDAGKVGEPKHSAGESTPEPAQNLAEGAAKLAEGAKKIAEGANADVKGKLENAPSASEVHALLFFPLVLLLTCLVGSALAFDGYRLEACFYFTAGLLIGATLGNDPEYRFLEDPDWYAPLGISVSLQAIVCGICLAVLMVTGRKMINAFASGLVGALIAHFICNATNVRHDIDSGLHEGTIIYGVSILFGFLVGWRIFPQFASLALCLLCSFFGGFLLAFSLNIVVKYVRGTGLIAHATLTQAFHDVMGLHFDYIHTDTVDEIIFFAVWGLVAIIGFSSQIRMIHEDYGSYTPLPHD